MIVPFLVCWPRLKSSRFHYWSVSTVQMASCRSQNLKFPWRWTLSMLFLLPCHPFPFSPSRRRLSSQAFDTDNERLETAPPVDVGPVSTVLYCAAGSFSRIKGAMRGLGEALLLNVPIGSGSAVQAVRGQWDRYLWPPIST